MNFEDYILNVVEPDPREIIPELPSESPKLKRSKALPERFTRRDKTPPVADQGQLGSCVGHAVYAVLGDTAEWTGKLQNVDDLPSKMWAYEMAKKYDDRDGESYQGTSLLAACYALTKVGCCQERFWPYQPVDGTNPLEGANSNASERKIKAFYLLNVNDTDKIRTVLLNESILYCFNVHKRFYTPDPNGLVPESGYFETDKVGGHAVSLIGWNTFNGKLFWEFQNSWGSNFGIEGRFFMSDSLFRQASKNLGLLSLEMPSEEVSKDLKRVGPSNSWIYRAIDFLKSLISRFKK